VKAVEKRIEKREENLPALPCRKPGHDGLFIFVKRDDENDAEIDAKIADIRRCARCKDKQVVALQHFSLEWVEKYKRIHEANQVSTGEYTRVWP
jgi:hypothetical protein